MSTTETEAAVTSISPKEFAVMVGSDPKTVRRFLRNLTPERAEKGGRWEIPNEAVDELKARWAARGSSNATVLTLAESDEDEQDAVDLEEMVNELEDEEDLDDIDEL